MKTDKKWITNHTAVLMDSIIVLAENGEPGDQHATMSIGKTESGDTEGWIDNNGGPVLITEVNPSDSETLDVWYDYAELIDDGFGELLLRQPESAYGDWLAEQIETFRKI